MHKVKQLLLLLYLFPWVLCAQHLIVTDFHHAQTDLAASQFRVYDLNGVPCALLKVGVVAQDIKFEGDIIKVEPRNGEYWIYLIDGANWLNIMSPNHLPLRYDFFPVAKLNTYYLTIESKPSTAGMAVVRIGTNVPEALLSIDTMRYSTTNAEFNIQLSPGQYNYTLTTSLSNFQPTKGTFVVTDSTHFMDLGRIDLPTTSNYRLTVFAEKFAIVTIDDQQIKNNGRTTITIPAGLHYIKASTGEQHQWSRIRTKNVLNDDTVEIYLRGNLTFSSPSNSKFKIEPIADAVKPSKSKYHSGETALLLGSYNVTCSKKNYVDQTFRVNIDALHQEPLYRLPMITKWEANVEGIPYNQNSRPWRLLMKNLKKLADQNDELAQNRYAELINQYQNALPQAIVYWGKAASLGNPQAIANLARHSTDPSLRKNYYLKAFQHGLKECAFDLACEYLSLYRNGNKLYADSALYWFTLDYYQGDIRSVRYLGDIYSDGIGTDKNLDLARKYYSEALSLDSSDAIARERLLDIDYCSTSNPAELDSVMVQYRLLRSTKHFNATMAQRLIQYHFQRGEYRDISPYVDYVGQPHNLTLSQAEIMTAADSCYRVKLFDEAFTLYRLADKLDASNSVKANCRLGEMYLYGKGVQANLELAKSHLKKTIGKSPSGTCMLGDCYFRQSDFSNAKVNYQKAIEMGYVFANGKLGTLYAQGKGVKKDLKTAEKYWLIAAKAGHQASIQNLIVYYEKVSKNNKQANYWKKKLNTSKNDTDE